MARDTIYVALDIGSSEVVCLVSRRSQGRDGYDELEVLGIGKSRTFGIRRGTVSDIEEASSSISQAISEAEQVTGVSIHEVSAGLKGSFIHSINSFGGVAISSYDDEIEIEDIARAVESTKKIAVPYASEIVHVLPRAFTIDGQTGIRNPIGMSGLKLETETHIVMGNTPVIKNILKSIERSGVKVSSLVCSSVASGYKVLSTQQRELGAMILDIGRDGVGISIFQDGEIAFTGFSPIGSGLITRDISVGVKTSYSVAEKIKLQYGHADPFEISEDETFSLSEFAEEDQMVSRKYITQIINARVREMFKFVKESIATYDSDLVLPAGVSLVGGGALLAGIVPVAKKSLDIPVHVGFPSNISGIADLVSSPKYAPVSSLAQWMFDTPADFAKEFNEISGKSSRRRKRRSGASNPIINWFKSFLP